MFRGLGERIRALAERLIPGLLSESDSAQDVVNKLQQAGIDYGRGAMLSDVEQSQAEQDRAEISAPFDPSKPVPETFFRDRRWRSVWDYHYEFRYSYYDENLKMTVEDYFTIVSKERLSTNQLQPDVDAMTGKIAQSLGARVLIVELVSGVHVVSGRK